MENMINDPYALDQYLDIFGEDAKDFIADLINTFLEDAPKQFSLLDQGLADNDPVVFRRAAHTLKSTCKTFGANDYADQLFVLEELGALGDLSTVSNLVDEVRAKFSQLEKELIEKRDSY